MFVRRVACACFVKIGPVEYVYVVLLAQNQISVAREHFQFVNFIFCRYFAVNWHANVLIVEFFDNHGVV